MGNYTREEILQMAEEEDVEFIRLQFTDMFGTLKNIAITARELPRALDNRCIVDGSFIAGIAGESEPDMYLRPDLDTFAIPMETTAGQSCQTVMRYLLSGRNPS